MAKSLRSLAAGTITNDQFEKSIPTSNDPAIIEIFHKGGWMLYDDFREYKLKGKYQLDTLVKKDVARWVLFLKSHYAYCWPTIPLHQRVLYTLSFGLLGNSYQKQWSTCGDIDAWPFLRNEHFRQAKLNGGYLNKTTFI